MKRPSWLTIGILAALAVFTLLTLGVRSVAADEFSMYWASAQTPSDILALYFSPKENNPPGVALLQHFWGQVFGYTDVPLRVLSLVLVGAVLWVLWHFAQYMSSYSLVSNARNHQPFSESGARVLADVQNRVFLLAATTPLVWMSANIARYQALAMLLGVSGLYAYTRWFREKEHRFLLAYALCAGLLFYVHYLSAAVFALCAGLHYVVVMAVQFAKQVSSKNKHSAQEHSAQELAKEKPFEYHVQPREIMLWASAQVGIILMIVPIIFTILNAYSTINLGVSAPVQSNKIVAAIAFLSATLIGVMNGFAVAPYALWAVVPMAFIMPVLAFIALRRSDILNNRYGWMLVLMPLLVMSAVVVKMYPPLTMYLIPSVQRVPFVAPVLWVFLGFALVRIANKRLQTLLFVVILLCNAYAIAVWDLNIVATQHTPPLQELHTFTRLHTKGDSSTTIAHTVAYRYGMEGVNSTSPSSKNAVERYLPEIQSLYWAETDIAKEVSLDSCKNLVRSMNTRHWVVFQRNRYAVNAQHLADALTQEGYSETAAIPAQQQSGFDVWMKSKMMKLSLPGLKDDALPQRFIYTFRHFERVK
ncbi:MAG: hypothetical protein EAZ92_04550 [Candidatus Kapaibacterium sp.]|nr:MAG: hypothetical protein EAZ92_04550 [Candidatus Kapabacteria bacterium]